MPLSKSSIKTKELTPRQKNLLFAVIKEYCEISQGIGSKEIKSKYNFPFSSATIRNEFTKLREMGYLYQPFTNSSNCPTEKAFKLFINQMVVGLQITNQQQKELKKHILELEKKQADLNKEISRLLALKTDSVGFSLTEDKESYSGISNLLKSESSGKVSDILDFLDNLDTYKKPLLENKSNQKVLKTFIGTDNPIIPLGKGYALAATEVVIKKQKTVIGIIAPTQIIARQKNLEILNILNETLKKTEIKKR